MTHLRLKRQTIVSVIIGMLLLGAFCALIVQLSRRHSAPNTDQAFYMVSGTAGQVIFRTEPTKTSINQKDVPLFTAKDIEEYTIAGNDLYVALSNDDFTSKIMRVNRDSVKLATIALPFAGTVSMLRASPDGTLLGFALLPKDTKKHQENLYLYHIATQKFQTVTGNNKKRFEPLNWKFASDSRTMVIKDADATLYIVDRLGKTAPKSLGTAGSLSGFTADRKTIIAADLTDDTKAFAIDVQSAKRSAFPTRSLASDQILTGTYPFRTRSASLLYIQQVKGENSEDQLFYDQGSTRKMLYQADETSVISAVTLSPNEQYVAVEVTDLSDDDDATNVQTIILDSNTGERVGVVQGSHLQW